MSVQVACINCGRVYTLAGEMVGKSCRCKACGASFVAKPATPTQPAANRTIIAGPAPVEAAPRGDSSPPVAKKLIAGRYEVRGRLGKGAYGVVYRAFDLKLGREVAVKMLNPEALQSREAAQRFLREAEILAGLGHPNIVPIFDKGQEGRSYFLVLQLVKGRPLSECIPQGGFSDPRLAVRYASTLARTLQAAYSQRGILHRDVKPANIMVEDEHLYLMDFGLAVCRTEGQGLSIPANAGGLATVAGIVIGTPAYMPPEQASYDPDRIGPWSDLYSTGAVLYHCLTGTLPIPWKGLASISDILHTPPVPPSHHRPDIDASLDALVLQSLAKQPEDRFQSGKVFAEALQAWLDGVRSSVPVNVPPDNISSFETIISGSAAETSPAARSGQQPGPAPAVTQPTAEIGSPHAAPDRPKFGWFTSEGTAAPWIGLAGSLALFIGVFLPLTRDRSSESINYISDGHWDGMAVAALAVLAAATSLTRWHRSLWAVCLLVLALLTFTFTHLQVAKSQPRLEWGWAILAIGALATVASAISGMARRNASNSRTVVMLGAISMILVIGATAASTWGVPKIVEAQRQADLEKQRRADEERHLLAVQDAKKEAERREAARLDAKKRADEQKVRDEAAKRDSMRDKTVQTLMKLGGSASGPAGDEWADAASYKVGQGNVWVRLASLSVDNGTLTIELIIENLGRTGVSFSPWSRADTGADEPVLLNPEQNRYRRTRTGAEAPNTLSPGRSVADRLVFGGFGYEADYLGLELPASAFNGYGKLRLRIPESMLLNTAIAQGGAALPVLKKKLLDSRDPKVRSIALVQIGRIRPPARDQLETVADCLADKDADVREAAATLLKSWEPYGRQDISRLRALLQPQRKDEPRAFAVEVLSRLGPDAAVAVTDLVSALHDESEPVRQHAATALGKLGTSGSDIVSALELALSDKSAAVRQAAVRSLAGLPADSGNLDCLIRAVSNSEPAVAVIAAEAVSLHPRLGKNNPQALFDALHNGSTQVRAASINGLKRLGPDVPGVTAAVGDALKDQNLSIRKQAAQTLGTFGMNAKPYVPALAKCLDDADVDMRRTAAKALAGIGSNARDAVEKLFSSVLNDTAVATDAEAALLKIGSSAAYHLITVADKDPNSQHRIRAIGLLERLGPDAKKVLPELKQLATSDPISSVRNAAAQAVRAIENTR